MNVLKRQPGVLVTMTACILAVLLAQDVAAMTISGLGSPSSHPDLAGGSVIDFEANADGETAITFGYADVSMTGNDVLRISAAFGGSFNVTGNSLALTTNDLTQQLTLSFLSPVTAFGFNFGGADVAWRLSAYSAAGALLDEQLISPFGNSNDGAWFGISAPGISSARLHNTAFDIGAGTGTPDYVVIDNVTVVRAIPEPATTLLMGLNLAGLCLGRLRRLTRVR